MPLRWCRLLTLVSAMAVLQSGCSAGSQAPTLPSTRGAITGISNSNQPEPANRQSPTSESNRQFPTSQRNRQFPTSPSSNNMFELLPSRCTTAFTKATLKRLLDSISTGDSATAVAQFSPNLRSWDVYLAVPGSPGGTLRTPAEIAKFVGWLHARGNRWTLEGVEPPSGTAGMPEWTVYGVGVTVQQDHRTSSGVMKVVMDCVRPGILRAVGPGN